MKSIFIAIAFVFASMLAGIQSAHAQTPPTPAVNEALLSWDYTAGDEAGILNFTLERKAQACAGPLSFGEIAAPAKTLRWYLDQNLTRGVTYCYRAYAVGPGIGGKSGPSNTVEKAIPPAPVAPTNLR